MRRFRAGVVLAFGLFWLWLAAGPASAFPLSHCTLSVTSKDAGGAVIGTATSGADDATATAPLEVDLEGSVDWSGTSGGSAIHDSTHHVDVYGVPTPLRDDSPSPNNSDNTSSTGTESVGDNLPFAVTGLYYVSGEYTGEGVTCAGSLWIKLRGDPVGSAGFAAAIVSMLLGLAVVASSLRGRHPFRGLIGGLLAGLGAALLVVTFGVATPLEQYTPLAVLLTIALVALAVGLWDFGNKELSKKAQDEALHCDELAARLRTMKESRARRYRGIEQGMSQLGQAMHAEAEAVHSREVLSFEHAKALGLLGGAVALAGGALTAALGGIAAAASAAGNALTSAVGWLGGAGESAAALDYIPVMAGGLEPEIGLGVQLVQQATVRAAAHVATAEAATAAAVQSGGATAGAIAAIEHGLSSALAEVDAAMAKAVELRQRLEAAIRDSLHELGRLDSEIGDVLKELESCQNVLPADKVDPRTPPPGWPAAPGTPIRG